MNDHLDDDSLLEELADLLRRADPVPHAVLEAARAAIEWRDLDAELAALVADSARHPDDRLALVRGVGGPRTLSFSAGAFAIELEVAVSGTGRSLVGQLVPPAKALLEVFHPGGRTEADSDELGRFAVDWIPAGPMMLRCSPADGRAVVTEWTAL